MKNNSISFSELANFNDSNSCVMVALIINNEGEVDETMDAVTISLSLTTRRLLSILLQG